MRVTHTHTHTHTRTHSHTYIHIYIYIYIYIYVCVCVCAQTKYTVVKHPLIWTDSTSVIAEEFNVGEAHYLIEILTFIK